jgi:hypothetical protein
MQQLELREEEVQVKVANWAVQIPEMGKRFGEQRRAGGLP